MKKDPITWIDVREDKTANSTHMRATMNGHVAEVYTLPRSGNGKDWGADAGGCYSDHKRYELAIAAAEKRLRAAAAKGPALAPKAEVVSVRPDGLLTDEGIAEAIGMGESTVAQGLWLSEHGHVLLIEARDSRALLRRIVAAWREDEIGQVDGALIEEAEKLLGIAPAPAPLAAAAPSA